MPKCCVKGCGSKYHKNQPNISLHRFPINEFQKKKWLDFTGIENFNPEVKERFVCSLHFEDSCFNRTLHIVRLRENSVPTRFRLTIMDNSVVVGNQKDTKVQDKPDIQAIDVRPVCRACLAQSDELENIFKVFTAEMFAFCTSVEISESDGMPDSLCQKCFWLLNRVYYFKQLVLRSDNVLKQGIRVKASADDDNIAEDNTDLYVDSPETNETHSPTGHSAMDDHTYCSVADTATPSGQSNMQNTICLPLQINKTQPAERRIAFRCPKCGKTTHDYEKLTLHLNMHLNEKLKTFKKVRVMPQKPPKPLNYTCNLCGVTLKTVCNYKNHLKRHTAIRNIPCPTCGKCFALQFDLKSHMRTHATLKLHKCDICDKSYKERKNLESHHRTHTGERPFECEFCHVRYRDKVALRLHRTIHTGERPHKCEICDCRFTMKSVLDKHLRTHAPKAKKPRNSIKYHEMLLSTERRHECEVCRRAFKRKCGLARHMKIHGKHHVKQNEELPRAPKAKKPSSSIKHHEMLLSAERQHECQICRQAFKKKCGLARHVKVHDDIHPVKQNEEVLENKDAQEESFIDFIPKDEVIPNTEFPINEQLQYAIMKVCSDIYKVV